MGSIVQTYAIGKTQITSVDLSNLIDVDYIAEGSTDLVGDLVKMGADTRFVRGMSYILTQDNIDYAIAAEVLANASVAGELLVNAVYLDGATNGDTSTDLNFGSVGSGETDGSTDIAGDLVRVTDDAYVVKGLDVISTLDSYGKDDDFEFSSATPILFWAERFSGYDYAAVIGAGEIDYADRREFEFPEQEVGGDTTILSDLSIDFSIHSEVEGIAYTAFAMDDYGEAIGNGKADSIDVYAHNHPLAASIVGSSTINVAPATEQAVAQPSSTRYVWLNLPSATVVGTEFIGSDGYPFVTNGPEEEYDGLTFGPSTHHYDFHYSISAYEVYTSLPILSGAIFGITNVGGPNDEPKANLSVDHPISGESNGRTTLDRPTLDNTYTRYHEADDIFTVCTSTTRPGSPNLGDTIYETDTEKTYMWDGSNWVFSNPDGRYFSSLTGPTGGGIYK